MSLHPVFITAGRFLAEVGLNAAKQFLAVFIVAGAHAALEWLRCKLTGEEYVFRP